MAVSRPPRFPYLALLLLALPLAWGCSDASPQSAPNPDASTATPPAAATEVPRPTPQPEDLGEGWVEVIRKAWRSIVDYHIAEPEPRPLLEAAWRAVAAEARSRGAATGPPPSLDGDADTMWAAFKESYLAVLHGSPAEAWQAYRYAALTGMTASLNDCHTFFLPPARTEVLTDIRTGRPSGGIGVELAPVRPTYVRETIPGAPADSAGVLPGDFLVSVDGQDVSNLGIEVIQDLLRGEPGSPISIQVRRPSTGAVHTFPLTRAIVHTPVAQGRVLPDGSGYIRIRSFTSGSTLREALDRIVGEFEAGGVDRWVLDLRDNPGGDSDVGLAGRFIGGEVAERTLLRAGGVEVRQGEGEPWERRPLAVLVNSGTTSVAEIFAAMLQDHGRARVFGSQTGRCAGFVSLETFPDGSTLGVTIARSLTPVSERPLWQTGVIPDAVVRQTQADVAAARDPVLDAALSWLRSQVGR
ncbi:MAG TPA: S41 family peptidase [Dehalococcoidia bacterium]|nr:S41 family peptidase [Dehalococcoidia bacterium]